MQFHTIKTKKWVGNIMPTANISANSETLREINFLIKTENL